MLQSALVQGAATGVAAQSFLNPIVGDVTASGAVALEQTATSGALAWQEAVGTLTEATGGLFFATQSPGGGGDQDVERGGLGGRDCFVDPYEEMENLQNTGENEWKSDGGIIYRYDRWFGNRVEHVLSHLRNNPRRDIHTIFSVPRNQVIRLIDEAWALKSTVQPIVQGSETVYYIPMGRVIGTAGEKIIKIVIEDGINMITAFPWKQFEGI